MFESPDLPDLAFLSTTTGHQPNPTTRRGSLQFFSIDLDPDEAQRLLDSPERALFARYFQEWRRLRAIVDRLRDGGGRRP